MALKKAPITPLPAIPVIKRAEVKEAAQFVVDIKTASGTVAAMERLQVASAPTVTYKQRDFDREARGKTLCALYEAASASPAIAGMKFKNIPELFALQKEQVELQFKEIFPD